MGIEAMHVGAAVRGSMRCGPEHFASRIVADTPDVFSTPALGALVEKTAAEWMARHLDEGQMTVGTQLVINHTAATPEGMVVTAEVRLVAVDGRRFDFEWTAHDAVEQVGHGTHQRFVLDRARFDARLAGKRGEGG